MPRAPDGTDASAFHALKLSSSSVNRERGMSTESARKQALQARLSINNTSD